MPISVLIKDKRRRAISIQLLLTFWVDIYIGTIYEKIDTNHVDFVTNNLTLNFRCFPHLQQQHAFVNCFIISLFSNW